MAKKDKKNKLRARQPKGFEDAFADDVLAERRMLDTLRRVYERYGFEPLETPAFEYVDCLGKFLPESDQPDAGIFALQDPMDEQWIALRYDLTAPLARSVAQNNQAGWANPFRRYAIGPVWRQEKPEPGRFRQFTQCDFDTVGTASMSADAEVCAVLSTAIEELGISRDDYTIKVNNRKVLNGVLASIGLGEDKLAERANVLRATDKLDRLGIDGVRDLLGPGRKDDSGDFTKGVGLSPDQIDRVVAFVECGSDDRGQVTASFRELVGNDPVGLEGVAELETIGELLDSMGLGSDRVLFDPSLVRGLGYYTGPVFEAELNMEIVDEKGRTRRFGSVSGGGRYDDLVKRFTGQSVPATGCSIGVSRLLAALKMVGSSAVAEWVGPVVVTVMDSTHLVDYQRMTAELRAAGIRSEMYLGTSGFKAQMKYADKRRSPIAVIAGDEEFKSGRLSLKDLFAGKELSQNIESREEWTAERPAQVDVDRGDLVSAVKSMLAAQGVE